MRTGRLLTAHASRQKPPGRCCACWPVNALGARPQHPAATMARAFRHAAGKGAAAGLRGGAGRGGGRVPELAQARRRGRRVAAEQHHAVFAAHLRSRASIRSVTAARGVSRLARATAAMSSIQASRLDRQLPRGPPAQSPARKRCGCRTRSTPAARRPAASRGAAGTRARAPSPARRARPQDA